MAQQTTRRTKKPASNDYQQYTAEVLARLDIAAEAEKLGVQFASAEPGKNGWQECHAIGREDGTPSAVINVGGGRLRGKYRDLGSSERAISFFELAARLGPWSDWQEAREHYATIAGVEPATNGKKPTEPNTDQYQPMPWRPESAKAWCSHHKPGVEYDALVAVGAQIVKWPYRDRRGNGHHCLAIPSHDGRSDTDHPAGMVLLRLDGQLFPPAPRLQKRKIHTLRSSRQSFIAAGGVEAIQAATIVWWVEGVPDCLALTSRLSAGEIAITSIGGANERPERLPLRILAGKPVRIIGDCDTAGQDGAEERARALQGIASGVEVVRLPYPIEHNHGKDLRDWLCDGHGYDDLLTLPATEPEPAAEPESRIANYTEVWGDGDKPKRHAIDIRTIHRQIDELTKCQLSVCGNTLFVRGSRGIRWLRSYQQLFAWLHEFGPIDWATTCHDHCPVSREEIYHYLTESCERVYIDIATDPHCPPIESLYYAHDALPKPTGKTLDEFLAATNPESEDDRELIRAAMLTMVWGGGAGLRPAFVFTSKHGTGAGKTLTAETLAEVFGGAICRSRSKNSSDEFTTRLLSRESREKRVVLYDNLKGVNDSASIESLITSKRISGKQMYQGEGSRPNYLTWLLTANSPSLSRDLAERSVVIEIGRPKPADFVTVVAEFLVARRKHLVADLLHILQGPSRSSIAPKNWDRWRAWQIGVLEKLDNADRLAELIISRRRGVDGDSEEADAIKECIESYLARCRIQYAGAQRMPLDPATEKVGIPTKVVYQLLRGLWDLDRHRATDKLVRGRLNQSLHSIPELSPNPCMTYGRTFLWTGATATGETIYPWSGDWRNGRVADFDDPAASEEKKKPWYE